MGISNYMFEYNYTAYEELERFFRPLVDSLMSFVNMLITIIVIIAVIYLFFYMYSSIAQRRRFAGTQVAVSVIKDSVTSLNMIGDYIVVKTKRNSIHTFSDPIAISIRETKPYTNLGSVLIAVGLLFFITPRVLEFLNINIYYFLPVSTFFSLIVLIALLSSGILLLMIRDYTLYIETKTGSKTVFTSIRMNPAEAELVIYKYLENKQRKLNVEEEKKESEQASRVENKQFDSTVAR